MRIPILMYHGIRQGRSNPSSYLETNTSPEVFSAHMKWLCEFGYETITLNRLAEYIKRPYGRANRVAITFDDGYEDFYEHAFPVLRDLGFTATVFVISGSAGSEAAGKFMSWRQIRAIHADGIEIGSHTVTHRKLWTLSMREVEDEVRASKAAIEDALGASIFSFSHPFAFPEQDKRFVSGISDVLATAGYSQGVSTIIGTASAGYNEYALPRLPVNSCDDRRLLLAKLNGAYDWMHVLQRLYKRARSLRPVRWTSRSSL